jgi:hypothetical protein
VTQEPTKRYSRLAQQAQRDGRIPALAVALHRGDRPMWTYEIGAEPDTQFRIGSVTKTFTAVLVMRCWTSTIRSGGTWTSRRTATCRSAACSHTPPACSGSPSATCGT